MTPVKDRLLPEELRRVEYEFFRTTSTLIISAVGLVAALAWNTAITKILEEYLLLKPESSVWSWLIYAVIVTLLAVIATLYLGRLAQRFGERLEKKEPHG